MNAVTAANLTNELLQIIRAFPRLDFREYTIEGLTGSEKGLLLMLMTFPGEGPEPLPVSELSRLLKITPGGVTHLLNPLEEQGFIERLPDAKDRRIVRVGLTRKGKQAGRIMVSEAQRQVMGLIEHLGEKDSRALIQLIARSLDYFEKRPANQKK